MIILLTLLAGSSARADELAPPDRVGGKDVFTFLGKDFTTDAEACAAGTPKADGWSPNGASAPNKAGMIECHYKHKDGEKKSLMQVRQSLLCPALSTSKDPDGDISTRFCQCDRGLIAMSGACVPKPADAGAVPAKPKEDRCKWVTPSTQTNDTSKNAALLRKNLGGKPGDGLEAHHIVFSTWKDGQRGKAANESRKVLDKFCIDINSSDNGVLLSHAQHHGKGLHTIVGANKIRDELAAATTRNKAIEVLVSLKKLIAKGQLVPGYIPKPRSRPKTTPDCEEED